MHAAAQPACRLFLASSMWAEFIHLALAAVMACQAFASTPMQNAHARMVPTCKPGNTSATVLCCHPGPALGSLSGTSLQTAHWWAVWQAPHTAAGSCFLHMVHWSMWGDDIEGIMVLWCDTNYYKVNCIPKIRSNATHAERHSRCFGSQAVNERLCTHAMTHDECISTFGSTDVCHTERVQLPALRRCPVIMYLH